MAFYVCISYLSFLFGKCGCGLHEIGIRLYARGCNWRSVVRGDLRGRAVFLACPVRMLFSGMRYPETFRYLHWYGRFRDREWL